MTLCYNVYNFLFEKDEQSNNISYSDESDDQDDDRNAKGASDDCGGLSWISGRGLLTYGTWQFGFIDDKFFFQLVYFGSQLSLVFYVDYTFHSCARTETC